MEMIGEYYADKILSQGQEKTCKARTCRLLVFRRNADGTGPFRLENSYATARF